MGRDLNGNDLGEGITQRKDGRYQARYTDRFGNRKTLYARTLKEIREKFTDADYENRKCMNSVNDATTLDEWYQKWMRVYKIPNIRQNTKRHYASVYTKHISPTLGKIRLNKITKLQIQSLINDLHDKGLQWETQNKVRMLLTDMFNYAIGDQFVIRNPCKGVKCRDKKPNKKARYLTEDEQALFFECCAGRWYDNLFNVAINTGLRPGELAALTWDNIDLRNMVICVKHTLVYQKFEGDSHKTYHLEDTKTTKSTRNVPINDDCLKYLKRQYLQKGILSRKTMGDSVYSDRLFVTRRNNPINGTDYSHAIREILRDINEMLDPLEQIEDFSGHTFRHTFATRCIESGVKPKTLQILLGHANINTTMDMYVHVDEEFKHEQMKLVENNFSPWDSISEGYEREKKLVNFR